MPAKKTISTPPVETEVIQGVNETVLTVTPAIPSMTITVKATIPTQEYGNIVLEVVQSITPADEQEHTKSGLIMDTIDNVLRNFALTVLPLAEAEVTKARPALLREAYPDSFLQRNSPLYRWLRVVQPGLNVPAMQDVISDESRKALIPGNKNK